MDARTAPSALAARSGSLRWAWYLAYVLALLFALSYIDRQITGILVEPMKRDLRMTDTQLSLVGGTSFVVFYVAFGLLMGRAADTYSRKWIVISGVVVWTLSTALCGLSTNVWQLLILRMGVGLGEAALVPSTYSMLGDAFPRHKLTTAVSLTSAAGAAGMGLAFFCGAWVLRWATVAASADGTVHIPLLGAVAPWRVVFLSVGLPGLLFAALLLPVREPARTGRRAADSGAAAAHAAPFAQSIAYLKANRRLFTYFYLGMGCIAITGYTASFWDIAFFTRTYGWAATESGRIYGTITVFTAITGAIAGGRIADHLTKRWSKNANLVTLAAVAALNVPFRLLYPLMPTAALSVVFAGCALFVLALPWGVAAAALQIMVPSRMRGQFTSIFVFVNTVLGMAVGPTTAAVLTDYVFADTAMLRYSLLIAGTGAQILATVFFWKAVRPYQATLANALAAERAAGLPAFSGDR